MVFNDGRGAFLTDLPLEPRPPTIPLLKLNVNEFTRRGPPRSAGSRVSSLSSTVPPINLKIHRDSAERSALSVFTLASNDNVKALFRDIMGSPSEIEPVPTWEETDRAIIDWDELMRQVQSLSANECPDEKREDYKRNRKAHYKRQRSKEEFLYDRRSLVQRHDDDLLKEMMSPRRMEELKRRLEKYKADEESMRAEGRRINHIKNWVDAWERDESMPRRFAPQYLEERLSEHRHHLHKKLYEAAIRRDHSLQETVKRKLETWMFDSSRLTHAANQKNPDYQRCKTLLVYISLAARLKVLARSVTNIDYMVEKKRKRQNAIHTLRKLLLPIIHRRTILKAREKWLAVMEQKKNEAVPLIIKFITMIGYREFFTRSVKKFKTRVIFVQRMYRKYLRLKKFRLAMLSLQWRRMERSILGGIPFVETAWPPPCDPGSHLRSLPLPDSTSSPEELVAEPHSLTEIVSVVSSPQSEKGATSRNSQNIIYNFATPMAGFQVEARLNGTTLTVLTLTRVPIKIREYCMSKFYQSEMTKQRKAREYMMKQRMLGNYEDKIPPYRVFLDQDELRNIVMRGMQTTLHRPPGFAKMDDVYD